MSASVEITPLSARSTVLSLLLGSHPTGMSAAELVLAGEHFGIPPATTRVALTRAVGAGDLRRRDGHYSLGERLARRQQRQNEAVLDAEGSWDGRWELAIVITAGRTGSERATLRDRLTAHRLAELREGVWTRPANLTDPRSYAQDPVLSTFTGTPDADAGELAHRLWDLDGWAHTGHELLDLFATTTDPATELAVAARLVRHLASDPLLPVTLLPSNWPAQRIQTAYASYQEALRVLALGARDRE